MIYIPIVEEGEREAREEIIESETGVEREDSDDIYYMFQENLLELYYDIEQAFKFRLDIELSDINSLEVDEKEHVVFTITHKIDSRCCIISSEFSIDDSWGGSSDMTLQLKLNDEVYKFHISYQNGYFEYTYDQECYLPLQADVFDEMGLNVTKDSIIDFIDNNFENFMESVDNSLYSILKDGGNTPDANIPCCKCREEYICTDESFIEYGRCLNCVEMNDICVCERCGNHFVASESDYAEDEPRLCGKCLKEIDEE